MNPDIFLLMPPLLLAQQITTTISTRAKVGGSLWYCGAAAFASHFTWILSNAFALWQIGKAFSDGITLMGVVAVFYYCTFASAGNMIGWWIGRKFER